MNSSINLSVFLLIVLFAVSCNPDNTNEITKPNILIILTDDAGRDTNEVILGNVLKQQGY